jgi:hypothetical protein
LARKSLKLVRADRLLADGFRAFLELLRFGGAALSLVEIGEIAEAGGDQRMIRTKRLLANRERAFEQRLRLGKASLRFVERAEPSQRRREFGIVLAVALAGEIDIAFGSGTAAAVLFSP